MTAPALTTGVPLTASPMDRAVSDTGYQLRQLWSDAVSFSGSIAFGEPRVRALEVLDSAFLEANESGWDGEGAAPADPSSYAYARSFLCALPASVPIPAAYVDPDGELCLEWDNGPRSVFSVSIGRDGTLSYAGLFGASKSHGVEPFADTIPVAVSQGIRRVLSRT